MESKEPNPALDRLMEAHVFGLKHAEQGTARKLQMRVCLGKARSALRDMFGASSLLVRTYSERITSLDKNGMSTDEFMAELQYLSALISSLERMGGATCLNATSYPSAPPAGRKVFIIHGHDELNTHRLKNLVRDHFGLTPVVLFEKAGMSRPLIDKYEDDANSCCFAFALCTPDDDVSSKGQEFRQSRPNVLFETGWFVGRLGRERVVLLLKEGTRIHSDLDGVSRIQFKESIEEKVVEIHRELEAAGLLKKMNDPTTDIKMKIRKDGIVVSK